MASIQFVQYSTKISDWVDEGVESQYLLDEIILVSVEARLPVGFSLRRAGTDISIKKYLQMSLKAETFTAPQTIHKHQSNKAERKALSCCSSTQLRRRAAARRRLRHHRNRSC